MTSARAIPQRTFAIFAALSFLALLVAATPHRVHHLFDSKSAKSCPVLTLSKGCDARFAAENIFAAALGLILVVYPLPEILSPRTSPVPHFSRAPPAR
ncbi:MAG TPA: hypothetical protein VL754_04860 [Verrucomicrobiae bacterium]|jgi:hypothetical protein|nr:hypothetical protein [Verrucomicrobiae bacterium]